MKMPSVLWYAAAASFAFVPVSIRMLNWPTAEPQVPAPDMVQTGAMLFAHAWQPHDPLCKNGDGIGPVYNATSCAACHHQAGIGGAGGLDRNVTVFVVNDGRTRERQGVVHADAINKDFAETLQLLSPGLPAVQRPSLEQVLALAQPGRRHFQHGNQLFDAGNVQLSQRNTPALFGANLIDTLPERFIIAEARRQRVRHGGVTSETEDHPVGRALVLPDGRLGRFGWKAQSATLSDFVRAACAGELGLGNSTQQQPAPLRQPNYVPGGLDLTDEQCDAITAFVAALPRPQERAAEGDGARAGRHLFHAIGCAECHTPNLGPVSGLYSDLLVHRMGMELEGSGGYNQPPPQAPLPSPGSVPLPDEWRTPPLWGVADSAPYLHDGRAPTLRQAIEAHAGQAGRTAQRFRELLAAEQGQLLDFLKSLKAPS